MALLPPRHLCRSTAILAVATLAFVCCAKGLSSGISSIRYRNGKKSDELKIATTLAKELMNPLGVQFDRFVVAVDDCNSNDSGNNPVVGWAQIKPLGKATAERDSKRFNAPPGSYDLEQDVDDAMWEEFENDDSIQVPVGLASLPWTKEYREMEAAVKGREKRREQLQAEFRQQLKTSQLYELSSVYVEPAYRGQGIGKQLVRRVIRRQLKNGEPSPCPPTNIYLLTLATTVDWYQQNFGFEVVSKNDIPKPMAFEVTAGNLITKAIGAELCCMRGTPRTVELC